MGYSSGDDLFGQGTWSMGGKDNGNFKNIRNLDEDYDLELSRSLDNKNTKHCAVEFGFKDLYAHKAPTISIVDPPNASIDLGTKITFTIGVKTYIGTVHQINIHRAGAFARILVRKSSVTEKVK